MADQGPVYLFSYGALRQPDVQLACFGRILTGSYDSTPGSRAELPAVTDPAVLASSGRRLAPFARASGDPDMVTGTLYRVGEADLRAADAFEGADHVRKRVRLQSGIDAWTYVEAEHAGESARLAALVAAEQRAFALLDAIEAAGVIAAGRTELEIEADVYAIAARDFGVTAHWHDRVVRAGINTLCVAGEAAPDRIVAANDIVFLDLGPVFGDWEADVGRSYVVGDDPAKHRLVADLDVVFETVRNRFEEDPEITGAALYAIAHEEAEKRGWRFGGKIAGHLVGRFPYARSPVGRDGGRASPANMQRMRDPDALGQPRHWILEIHLVAPDDMFAGFYERLLLPAAAPGDQSGA